MTCRYRMSQSLLPCSYVCIEKSCWSSHTPAPSLFIYTHEHARQCVSKSVVLYVYQPWSVPLRQKANAYIYLPSLYFITLVQQGHKQSSMRATTDQATKHASHSQDSASIPSLLMSPSYLELSGMAVHFVPDNNVRFAPSSRPSNPQSDSESSRLLVRRLVGDED